MSRSEAASAAEEPWVDQWDRRVRAAVKNLPSVPFLVGLLLGFAGSVVAGHLVSRAFRFENFLRFFGPIQPQQYFYPTTSLLLSHVRNTVPKDKTLVLVGGASYFRGTGQNPGELWSRELQSELGEHYAVINFAIDQADVTAFAAVGFEILAREYPHIVYVSHPNSWSAPPLDGGDVYRYIFWDAYYKDLLPPSISRAAEVARLRRAQRASPSGLELHLGAWADSLSYSRDLWTFAGYKYFFTVWSDAQAGNPFRARHWSRDSIDPNIAQAQINIRNDQAYIRHNEEFSRVASQTGFMRDSGGQWQPDPAFWNARCDEWNSLLPPDLKSKCQLVLLRGNPYFMKALTDDEKRRNETIYNFGRETLERAGYGVVPLREEDFTADDFLDGGHFVAAGGAKIAKAVAARILERERATEPRPGTKLENAGPMEFVVSLPSDRSPHAEVSLLALRAEKGDEAQSLFIEYLEGVQVRFGYKQTLASPAIYSPPLEFGPGAPRKLQISLPGLYSKMSDAESSLSPPTMEWLRTWLLLRVDDRAFWEAPLGSMDARVPFSVVMASDKSGITAHITAANRLALPEHKVRFDRVGGGRLRLKLVPGAVGRAFPLLTSGVTGEGDALFVRVLEGGDVVFGYDHWGVASQLSPRIHLGLESDHSIEFELPMLKPPGSKAPLRVTVDGALAWQQTVPYYGAGPDNVFFGRNPLNMTSAEATLENGIFESILIPSWRD